MGCCCCGGDASDEEENAGKGGLCGWLRCRKKGKRKKHPSVSAPLHLLLQKAEGNLQKHVFLKKKFKKPERCHKCHEYIRRQGSSCRVCKFICHVTCESEIQSTKVVSTPSVSEVLVRRPIRENPKPREEKAPLIEEEPLKTIEEQHNRGSPMELAYVTERIIALWFPVSCQDDSDVKESIGVEQDQMLVDAGSMLRKKHADNCKIFDLSIPNEGTGDMSSVIGIASHHLGWQGVNLAPPLERLCSTCKFIESWLSSNPQHVAVLLSRGPYSKERIGVVISAYLTYSTICGSEEQALDRFAMQYFLQDKIGKLRSPSNLRYVEHFSGLLSGGIRMNAEPLFLESITIHGAPSFDGSRKEHSSYSWNSTNNNGFEEDASTVSLTSTEGHGKYQMFCFFLKIYQQGLTPVYTSPVYEVAVSSEKLTILLENVQTHAMESPLHLRGDVLIKGYCVCRKQQCEQFGYNYGGHHVHRHGLFKCQFHTCAVAKNTLCFSAADLDEVECRKAGVKYPPDGGALELHFSGADKIPWSISSSTPHRTESSADALYAEPSLSSALYFPYADDEEEQFGISHLVAWDSMEELRNRRKKAEEGTSEGSWTDTSLVIKSEVARREEVVGHHLTGPVDGSLYATVVKQPIQSDDRRSNRDMDRHHRPHHYGGGGVAPSPGNRNGALLGALPPHPSDIDAFPEAYRVGEEVPPHSSADSPPLHARLDELLGDMLMTVENIPDLPPSPTGGEGRGGVAVGGGGAAVAEASAEDEEEEDEDIPYHARKDGRPFTYGAVPEQKRRQQKLKQQRAEEEMNSRSSELSSPGLVRRASRSGGGGSIVEEHRYEARKRDEGITTIDGYTNLTWLQRQQQKLQDRREGRTRLERNPQEFRLLKELRTYQRSSSSASGTQTLPSGGRWQSREDGYASDTSLPVGLGGHVVDRNGSVDGGDDWDGRGRGWGRGWGSDRGGGRRVGQNFTLPLRINTEGVNEEKSYAVSSEPGSPLLPRRSVSKETTSRYTNSRLVPGSREECSTLRTISSGVTMHSLRNGRNECQVDGERPFVAVKRAHELAASGHRSKDGTSSLDGTIHGTSQSRDDSFSSWATASMTWEDDEGDDDMAADGDDGESRRGKNRPQTPAFPVHPRTPYSNGSITPLSSVDQNHHHSVFTDIHGSIGLPPKSPTTSRKDRSNILLEQDDQRQPFTGLANGGTSLQRRAVPTHSNMSSPSGSQKHPSGGEPQEVSPAHVKFVRDTSRFWYKPTISREEAISILKDKQPGTFVVRDSNSFPGAFGLALKVATPPANVPNRSGGDASNELVRHFLIEPTSRGVKLKGCVNEPVFSSLSALVYQHSLTAMALPCRLILPDLEPTSPLRPVDSTDGIASPNQILLQQGAACNVLYLTSLDTESLTGPQAVRRAIANLFSRQPLPVPIIVHFKVSGQGITLTDNKRKLFFRRHYPVNTISHCGLDPDDHRWMEKNEEFGNSINSNRCFGFVARKPSTKGDNQCHIFAELDPEQPATAIVNFVTRVMMAGSAGKTSNIV